MQDSRFIDHPSFISLKGYFSFLFANLFPLTVNFYFILSPLTGIVKNFRQ
ncbi:hypothetical protein CLOLEP_00922 [[Clostridium] leptum DSM 753]|uniref:Uncharacterized protein n=1 Tax=[Clostridium] leptum DSM 753 TaxID=428125 RepID=A7VQU1_9FIRM|nr:hypothetical protein CLOLEP_00922 [[Clostridium] leptum DSM 753]